MIFLIKAPAHFILHPRVISYLKGCLETLDALLAFLDVLIGLLDGLIQQPIFLLKVNFTRRHA